MGSWQWPVERIIEAPTTTQEVVQEFNINHYMVIQHLKQTGKLKRLSKWVPHELTKSQKKIIISKCGLFLFCTTITNRFSIRLWCVTKVDFIHQPAMTSSVVGPRRSSKALLKASSIYSLSHIWLSRVPKPNFHQK